MGFDIATAFKEVPRCLNCDIQTVFTAPKCIECDACMDVCPLAASTFCGTREDESELRSNCVPAINDTQELMVSDVLKTVG